MLPTPYLVRSVLLCDTQPVKGNLAPPSLHRNTTHVKDDSDALGRGAVSTTLRLRKRAWLPRKVTILPRDCARWAWP